MNINHLKSKIKDKIKEKKFTYDEIKKILYHTFFLLLKLFTIVFFINKISKLYNNIEFEFIVTLFIIGVLIPIFAVYYDIKNIKIVLLTN